MPRLYALWLVVCFCAFLAPTVADSNRQCKSKTNLDWASDDCAVNAVCVPHQCNNSTSLRFCSCTFSEYMFKELPNGKCGSTPSNYAYAMYWVLDAVASLYIFFHHAWTLWISHKHKALRFDILNISCISNMLTSLFQFAYLVLIVLFALADLERTDFENITLAITIIHAIYDALILITALIFGVAVHTIFVQTNHLRKVDSKKLFRKVVFIALGSGAILMIGALALMLKGFLAAAYAFCALFAVFLWFLFRRIIIDAGGLMTENLRMSIGKPQPPSNTTDITQETLHSPTTNNNSNNSNNNSNSNNNGIVKKKGDHHHDQELQPVHTGPVTQVVSTNLSVTAMTINEIQIMAKRFAPLVFMFPCTVMLYNAFTYVGLTHCRKDLLTVGIACVNGISFSNLTLGFWFIASFSRRLANIRIQQAKLANAILA